jgi:hypothetical protein
VVVVVNNDRGDEVVPVLPITHLPPSDPALVIELSHGTKRRLGHDDERSWVVIAEANSFNWPGPDLRLMRGPRHLGGKTQGSVHRTCCDGRGKFFLHLYVALSQVESMTIESVKQ